MLADLYKIFTEEPEKATKAGIRIISTILLLIIAEWLYRQFFGNYHLMNLGEFRDWAEFILSGRIAVVIACYLIARYVIQSLLVESLLLGIIQFLCTRKFAKLDGNEIKSLLNFLNIVKTSEDKEIPKPGKHIDVLYEAAESFKKPEDVAAYTQMKHSLLNDILNFYALFLVVYFIFIRQQLHHNIFTGIVIAGFVFLTTAYIIINNIIEYGKKHHGEILQGIDVIKSHNLISTTLNRYGVKLYNGEEQVKSEEFFDFDDRKFALIIDYKNEQPDETKIAKVADKLKNIGRHLFFITKVQTGDVQAKLPATTGDNYTLVCYSDYADLEKQVKDKIMKKLLQQ